MRYRLLGTSGLRVSEVFLGAMTFGEESGPGASLEESRRMLNTYAEAGGNVIDTAINYRNGDSERFVGELLEGRRDRFVLASKYTVTRDREDPNAAGNHRKNLMLSLETSLKRLRTDYIDLYWVHIWDHHTPIEETLRALDDAVRAGKILYVGISDAPAWIVSRANTLAEWRGWSPLVALQVPYHLLKRDIERELLPMAEACGMSVATWGPLADGVLSGKFTRAGGVEGRTRLAPTAISERDHTVVRVVQDVAYQLGVTPAQVAISWIRSRSRAIHPILGARRHEQLVENLGALTVEIPPELMTQLDTATDFDPGFPTNFINATAPWIYGDKGQLVDGRL
ncbi:oxidoreductase [Ktedonobacter sp. SOSP1-52]|uniref:aldo/keto reductase n=1 Tax=Ktedonobacter sp. SOSP1-52 TaxID=2778366 RepID=UPI0019153C73|nr:aldo/keto reductase [Ktedonobacter sp. SOSP1-52]GHO70415.1 oxidoreductase [Ktedonobacter sp. SOSP1-52]